MSSAECPSTEGAAGTGAVVLAGMMNTEVRQELQREVRRLDGRTDGIDGSLRAVGDTLLDVKKVVDRHTVTLAEHGRILGEHTRTLDEHTRILVGHDEKLDSHTRTLDEHTQMLHEILRRLPEPVTADVLPPAEAAS